MNEYTTEDKDGQTYHVWIDTDIERFMFGGLAVPPNHTTFDYDNELQWTSAVYAWREGSDTATEVVNIRGLQYEPPTDKELAEWRENHKSWDEQLAEAWNL